MPRHTEYMNAKTQVALAGMLMLVFDISALERATKRPATTIRRWRDGRTRASVAEKTWMVRILRQRIAQMLTYPDTTYDHWLATMLRTKLRRIARKSLPIGHHRHNDIEMALVAFLEEHMGKLPVAQIIAFMETQGVNRRTVYNVAAKMQDRILKRDGVWHLKATGDK